MEQEANKLVEATNNQQPTTITQQPK